MGTIGTRIKIGTFGILFVFVVSASAVAATNLQGEAHGTGTRAILDASDTQNLTKALKGNPSAIRVFTGKFRIARPRALPQDLLAMRFSSTAASSTTSILLARLSGILNGMAPMKPHWNSWIMVIVQMRAVYSI
jgi:hypothetical protein